VKHCLLTILVLASLQSFAQPSIESLKTDPDIENFVTEFGKAEGMGWTKVSLSQHDLSSEERPYSTKLRNLASLVNKRWIITDFNNDGRKDLVFNGEIDGRKKLFSFISSDTSYQYINLQKSSKRTRYIRLIKVKVWSIVLTLTMASL